MTKDEQLAQVVKLGSDIAKSTMKQLAQKCDRRAKARGVSGAAVLYAAVCWLHNATLYGCKDEAQREAFHYLDTVTQGLIMGKGKGNGKTG